MFNAPLEIPNYAGWPEQTLENMCSVISRGTAPVYVEHSNVLAIGQRCISTSGFVPSFARPHSDRDQRNVLQPEIGDVLLNSTGTGTIGRSCVFNSADNFIVDGHVTLLRASPNKFRGEWLNAVLQTWWAQKHLERFCYAGSTNQLELSKSQLSATSIPVPSINEQDEFIKILRALNTTIHQTEAIIEKLQQVKQGLLHDLLTRGVDANGELRPSYEQAPELYQASPLGWIPKEWSIRLLGACADISSGVTLGRSVVGIGLLELPYLRVANVQDGYVDLSEIKTVGIFQYELERFSLKNGDVLMNEGGDYDKLGRGTVWRAQIEPCLHQNHVFRVRCNIEILLPDYLSAYSSSQRGKAFFIQSSKQSTNLASINSTQLKEFPIAFPDLLEQNKIIEKYSFSNARIMREENGLQKLKKLKTALMDDLLTGRVRVTPLLVP